MSNDWFQFRSFLIHQDQSAMKVGTDGVLLGAWADCDKCQSVLDIGTGTGLIALMLAQRNPKALITALEIDPATAGQASSNIQGSLWAGRMQLINCDFRTWNRVYGQKFDLIVCNPPFFTWSLKNPDIQRATARHDDDLPLSDLISKSGGMLNPEGKLAMIVPAGRAAEASHLATGIELCLHRRLDIRGNDKTPVKRILLEWGREYRVAEISEMVIETETRGVYSEEYKRLTGEFYLDFRGENADNK